MTESLSSGKYQFGEFELDARHGELRRNGTPIKVQLQPFQVLCLLVERAGQIVTREDLRRHVWGQETFVDYEQGLNYCIRQIRTALGDDGRYIETYPRRGYRFIAPVTEQPGAPRISERVMLAVLPLDNLSADPEQEYLSDGLTDEIITKLVTLGSERLGVIARTSAMQYKRTPKTITQIGKELAVDYVVEGTVRRNGNRVRISSQLIRVADQTHVWADVYERELRDVLLLQSELAQAIAGQIQVKLLAGQAAGPVRQVNAEAFEAYLKGRYLLNRRTKNDLFRALELFRAAIEKDTEYPAAFAGLADAYLVLLDYRYVRPAEALAQATAAAANALRLDEKLPDAHTALAHAKFHAFEWEAAEAGYRQAIAAAPGYAPAHFYYANLLIVLKRFDESLAEARQALKLDPVSMAAESNIALLSLHTGRYEESEKACRGALEIHPELPRPHEDLGRILLARGAYPEAIAALCRAVELSKRDARYLASLGHALAVSGSRQAASEILAELQQFAKQTYVDAYDFAFLYAALGEHDRAFERLEQAWEDRSSMLPFLRTDTRLASLRADPRFPALLTRIGFRSPELIGH